ncbi:MAG: NADH-quinone oxidoreductase subunit NuoG [Acidobacteria bacterium]|nr:NADH-quinone oxidoreductase subunit NuoG [Acidobacteriota bacterium]
MPDTVTISVDGRELQTRPGTLLIEACRAAGIEVPSFCYYPGLSLQAACRMCLVEIEKAPKLQTACTVPVAQGMIVRTATPQVAGSRKAILELLLANHPLDCPVCDKGGECELQDMVFRYGAAESRFAEEKRHVEEQQWSPVVYFDAPRCILCYRCVRVCNEGMGVHALGIVSRGANSEIAPNHGDHLECEECGMCIDICPVGALTSGAYRYKARPWEITYVATPCAHCADGCKTTLSVRNNKILRGNNRDHSGINGEFLCIKGRYGYDFVEHPERLRHPLVRRQGKLVEATWDEAMRAVASRWKELLAQQQGPGTSSFGVIGSNHTTNEENYLLQKFTRTGLRTNHIDHHRTADFPALMAALSALPNAASEPLPLARSRDLAQASAILLIGNNPTDQHPLLAWNIREAVRMRGARLYVINSREIPLLRQSHRLLPVAERCEGSAVARLAGESECEQKLTGRTPGGRDVTPELLANFRQALLDEKDVIVLFGAEVQAHDVAALVRFGSALQGRTRYIALADYSNSRGAADMGLLPHLLPGYQPVVDPQARAAFESRWGAPIPDWAGWSASEMLFAVQERRLPALYVVGANPWKGKEPDGLRGQAFLVVQDLFLTETAQAADVVLPAASAYEKTGTVTNTCGEIQRLRKAVETVGTRTDFRIIQDLAAALGSPVAPGHAPTHAEDVLQEIHGMVSGYSVSLAAVLSGGAEPVILSAAPSALESDGRGRIISASDTLFTSGTLTRYSQILQTVPERSGRNRLRPC